MKIEHALNYTEHMHLEKLHALCPFFFHPKFSRGLLFPSRGVKRLLIYNFAYKRSFFTSLGVEAADKWDDIPIPDTNDTGPVNDKDAFVVELYVTAAAFNKLCFFYIPTLSDI